MLVQTFQNLMRSLDANAAKKAADSANCMAPVLNNVIWLLNHSIDLVNNVFGMLLREGNAVEKLTAIDRYVTVRKKELYDVI